MQIVQYHPRARAGDGGITNSVSRLGVAFARAGADSVIAYDTFETAKQPVKADDTIRWADVPHSGPSSFRTPRKLAEVVRGASVVVLNSGWTTHNVGAARATRRMGVPYVVAARGAYDPAIRKRRRALKTIWWLGLERHVALNAAAHHVFFASQREHIRALGYDGPVLVAPNGVEVPAERCWDGGSGGYLLYVGRFDPEHKGLDLLLHGLRKLPRQQRPEIRLHGPDWKGGKQATQKLVRGLGLEPWVRVGHAVYGEEKWATITAAKAFVYPSRWEAFGNAPAEAAALGVPVLATPYPLGHYLASRSAANVVAATPDGLASGLNAVQHWARTRDHLGAAAELRADLSWDKVAHSWLEQLAALGTIRQEAKEVP